MRAYSLGYSHGMNDGYYSTLIERGGIEKSYDESLNVEYAAIDEVLAIIKDYDLYKADEDGDLVACRSEILGEIEALRGEQG